MSVDLVEKSFNSKIARKWEGFIELKHIFMNIYILEKYKKELYFLPFVTTYIDYGEDTSSVPLFYDYSGSLDKDGNIIGYAGIKDSAEYPFTDYKRISPYKELYKNTQKRFVYYPISLVDYDNNETRHSMFFLYDRKYNEVNLFDNAGYDMYDYEKYFKKFFQDIHGKKVKISYNTMFCVNLGKIVAYNCKNGYKYTSKGYCVIFTLWFLELRLKNSNAELNNSAILKKVFNRLRLEKPDRFCKIIIGYAQHVHKITDDYKVKYLGDNYIIGVSKKKMLISKYRNRLLAILVGIISTGVSYKLIYNNRSTKKIE